MTHPLFDKHRATLEGALAAIQTRGFWSAYPEQPSPKVYGETAQDAGKAAALAHMGQRFELGQPEASGWSASEHSPYGVPLGVQYPSFETPDADRCRDWPRCRPGKALGPTAASACCSKRWHASTRRASRSRTR